MKQLLLLLLCVGQLSAQQLRKDVLEMTMTEYNMSTKGDTFLVADQVRKYLPEGLVAEEISSQYVRSEGGVVKSMERYFKYDPNTKIGISGEQQYDNKYRNNVSNKVYYIHYNPNPALSKIQWEQIYDSNGEITKVDTLTYDAAGRIAERCAYSFRASTSLLCDAYKYNRKGQMKRWFMFSRWNTVTAKGEIKLKKSKRRDYKYSYNGRGKMVKVKGRYYDSYRLEKYKYDSKGLLLSKTEQVKTKTKDKETKKTQWSTLLTTEAYMGGKLVKSVTTKNNVETIRQEVTYQDTLPLKRTLYKDKKLNLLEERTYNTNGRLSALKNVEFREEKPFVTKLQTYNEHGDILLDETIIQDKTTSKTVYTYTYDETNSFITSSTVENKNSKFHIEYQRNSSKDVTLEIKRDANLRLVSYKQFDWSYR